MHAKSMTMASSVLPDHVDVGFLVKDAGSITALHQLTRTLGPEVAVAHAVQRFATEHLRLFSSATSEARSRSLTAGG